MKTILVIDDNETFRFILAEWLRDEGFYPITAAGGFEGVRLAQSHHPDVILCDVNMPSMNGIEVLQQLYADMSTSHIPFFFLTSEDRFQSYILQQPGASGVISKGSEISELRRILTAIAA